MTKNLLKMLPLLIGGTMFSQFSTGIVNLPTTAMTIKIDVNTTDVMMTLTGSSSVWLGVGFSADGMASGSDGFIYNSTANRDYVFNGVGVAPTADPAQNWTEQSNTVTGGVRTLVVKRTLAGGTGDFVFTNAAGSIPIFYGKGTSNNLAYHGAGNKDFATLTLTPSLAVDDAAMAGNKVSLYPNPVKDVLNFTNEDKIKSVKIFDATGKQLPSQKSVSNLNVSTLGKGVYFVEVEKKDGTIIYEKFIKN